MNPELTTQRTQNLLKQQECLVQTLTNCKPNNSFEKKRFFTRLNLLESIKTELINDGYSDLVSNVRIIPPKKESTTKYVPRKAEKKYKHKRIEVTRPHEIPTIELLQANDALIHMLSSFSPEDLRYALNGLEKYKLINAVLKHRNVPHNTFKLTPATYSRVVMLLGGKCHNCGTLQKLTIHHVVNKANGGTNDFENLELLCRCCHDIEHGFLTPAMKFTEALC